MDTKARIIQPETFLKIKNNGTVYKLLENSSRRGLKLVNLFNTRDTQITNIVELQGPLEASGTLEIETKAKNGSYLPIKTIDELNILLKMSDITTAIKFHTQNKYIGKVKNISNDGVYGALNKALYKNYGFRLNKEELKMVHQSVKTNKKNLGIGKLL